MGEGALSEKEKIAAVARHFSTVSVARDATAQTSLSIGGRQVVIDTANLRSPAGGEASSVRLRYDKVVVRVIGRLRAALGEFVPEGVVVLFTMTAPIRRPAKTIEALEGAIRALLTRSAVPADWNGEINGNHIRILIASIRSLITPSLTGFVHNPDTDPGNLLAMAAALLEAFGEADHSAKSFEKRWLLLLCDSGKEPIQDWRQVWAQLGVQTSYAKILIVSEGGSVETLAG